MRKHESVRMPTRKAEQRCLSKASLRLTSAKSGHEAKCDIPGVYTFSFLRLHQGLIQEKKVKQIPGMSVQPRTMVKSSQVMLRCDLGKAGDEVTCLKRASTFPNGTSALAPQARQSRFYGELSTPKLQAPPKMNCKAL